MTNFTIPTDEDLRDYVLSHRNWGRWGADDQRGAINLITAEKRQRAAGLVRDGRNVSLSRPLPKTPAANNPQPAQHWVRMLNAPNGASGVVDYYATSYHGWSTTHIDALCHTWDGDGMWNGRLGSEVISSAGAAFGSIESWSDGIVTRGVLLDVPKFRSEPYVTLEKPVQGPELEAIARAQGVTMQPGDAAIVYSGREAYDRAGNPTWGSVGVPNPGLANSCLTFLRDNDVAVLVWDMMDAPRGAVLPWGVHTSIFAFGVALVDNALLEPLAAACAKEGRYDFMLMLAPLIVQGGTGSPLNPIAMF